MSTILLTGFEPFGTDSVNPSADAVRHLASTWQGAAELVTDVLPVAFERSAQRLRELIALHRPDVVLAAGLAGGRAAVGIERVALNLIDARIPDNDGAQPVDVPSVPGAPPAYYSSVPVKAIAAALGTAGIDAEVSYTAGTFVCNHVMFTALDAAGASTRAGFIHLPWAAGQAPGGEPELPLADLARALEIALSTTLAHSDDLATAGGTLH